MEDYKRFLKSGCSAHPIDVLRYAGVDMSSPAPVLAAIESFADTLDELRRLAAEE